ncbi:hypothetical protein LRP49_22470 [Enterovibrio sp. ZSDZ35]|uniref:Exosortase/archaeosortase family protein n=1 Tax=Enterovibrio qingdaonensis TaxID=2899818 RepID=A0ABT5QTB9_9GAMM|nr:hypothetical protein [Enterovibrio sp. ZSDZ35]MDD1783948.1 hypothetical protein [Enterovibrio sp. ZSDZ35]
MIAAYSFYVKTRNRLFVPSIQRLCIPVLCFIAFALALPYFSDNAPTASEFDAIPAFVSLVFAFALLFSSQTVLANKSDNTLAICIALVLVFPSFQTTLLASMMAGIWLVVRAGKQHTAMQQAGVILIAHAFMAFMTFYSLKWFTEPLLAVDASLVAALLWVTTGTGEAIGNVYFGAADHQVLMLRNCSSLPAIFSAIACWIAISRWHGISVCRREALVIACLVCLLLILNIARLFSMGLSMSWLDWWHSADGEDIYLTLSALTTLAVIYGGLRFVDKK